MQFGSTVGTACLTFLITNIDDAFVLVTFFAESATSRTLTPLKITLGQYAGFTVIMIVSLIGFAVAVALPSEPIGFLGLLPLLLGVWRFFGLLFPGRNSTDEEQSGSEHVANARSVLKVAAITIMNGGDNIGTYIPLFSQAKGAEIAVYAVVYYVLLGVWCLVAFLIMKQKHILRVAEKYASFIIPFLYIGLGIYIVVKSDCYPWSTDEINDQFLGNPGQVVLGVVTTCLLSSLMGVMVWVKTWKRGRTLKESEEFALTENAPTVAKAQDDAVSLTAPADSKSAGLINVEQSDNGNKKPETKSVEDPPTTEHTRSGNKTQPKRVAADDEIQPVS